jgi:3-hydroxyacyl-[acyl-carrier-protein] dehydratase
MTTSEIYQITSFQSIESNIEATLTFNKNHPVFAGHFPGNPIVPGVVQVQIIKELMEKKTGKSLLLVQAKNIKFLSVISPLEHPQVDVTIRFQVSDDHSIKVQATLQWGDKIFSKFTGTFTQPNETNSFAHWRLFQWY